MFGDSTWPLWVPLYALFALSLSVYYAYLMRHYLRHWKALASWRIPPDFSPQTKLSVLIPARNEAANILRFLESILAQDYPKDLYEILLIDDHSTDDTAAIIKTLAQNHPQIQLISLADYSTPERPLTSKKAAIAQGVALATGELIVCTDADCWAPPQWLTLLASFYQSRPMVFIAGPVNFVEEANAFERFQSLDFVGMMGITGAGIQSASQHMCNGANLAYAKKAFAAVNGFSGIDGRASGDDMLLLQKMIQHFPGQVGFLKNPTATVRSRAMPGLRSFMEQRIRWASKSRDYPEWRVTLRLALVFFFCWSILGTIVLIPFGGWVFLMLLLIQLGIKGIADYLFLRELSSYFNRRDLLQSFALSAIYHLLYIAAIGLLANVRKTYEWKGRKVR